MRTWEWIAAILMSSPLAAPAIAQSPPGPTLRCPPPPSASAGQSAASQVIPPSVEVPPEALPMLNVSVAAPACLPRAGDGYTRLVLRYSGGTGVTPRGNGASDMERYRGEMRNWLRRFFAGKSVSRLFTVKTTLQRPHLAISTTLVSASHDSNKRVGESWTTEFNSERVLTPYFRLDPDTVVNLEIALALSSSYDMSFSKDTIDLLRRATQLVAPSAALITSLNQDRFKDASQFVDQSISNLFKRSILERSVNDFPMRDWASGTLATARVVLPKGNTVTFDPRYGVIVFGEWTISSEPVIASVFCTDRAADTDTHASCPAPDPARILNFEVDSGVSVAQALAGDAGIAEARDALAKAKDKGVDPSANRLCALVASKADQLGFSRSDAVRITWAYASAAVLSGLTDKLRDTAVCSSLQAAAELGLGVSTKPKAGSDKPAPAQS